MINKISMNNDIQQSVGFNHAWEAEKNVKLGRIEDLRRQYITLYTQRDAMITNERDTIYCLYIRLIGKTKYENFKLSVEVRALKLKVDFAQAALNRNQLPDLEEIERLVHSKLNSYFDELEQESQAIKAAEEAEGISRFTVKELRELYRVLVRRLHPDLHPDLSDCSKDLFVKGQTAYRTYDIDLLRDIIKRLDMDEMDTAIGDEDLDETIDRLTCDIEEIDRDIHNLRDSFPFNIEKDLLDPVWVNSQQSAMKEERTQLENQKAMYAERLDLLTE